MEIFVSSYPFTHFYVEKLKAFFGESFDDDNIVINMVVMRSFLCLSINWDRNMSCREELYKECVLALQGGLLLTTKNFAAVRDAIQKAFEDVDAKLLIW